MTTFSRAGTFITNDGPINGAIVTGYKRSRFMGVPAADTAPPINPDAGPVTTGPLFGAPGAFILALPTNEDYYFVVHYMGAYYWQLSSFATFSDTDGQTLPGATSYASLSGAGQAASPGGLTQTGPWIVIDAGTTANSWTTAGTIEIAGAEGVDLSSSGGAVTVPTALSGDASSKVASTAFVAAAVARSAFFDVQSYGAKGDSVTDDTAAIQATFLAAAGPQPSPPFGITGSTIYFPPGEYVISSPIFVSSFTGVVYGAGYGNSPYYSASPGSGSVIRWKGLNNTQPMFKIFDSGSTIFQHLRIEGNNTNPPLYAFQYDSQIATNVTASTSGGLNAAGQNTLTVSSTANASYGQIVTDTTHASYIPANTIITSVVDASNVTLSNNIQTTIPNGDTIDFHGDNSGFNHRACKIRDCWIGQWGWSSQGTNQGNVQTGVGFTGANANNDQFSIERCYFQTCTSYGLYAPNTQTVWGSVKDLGFDSCGVGLMTESNMAAYNLTFNRCGIDYQIGPSNANSPSVDVFKQESENSKQWIQLGSNGRLSIRGGSVQTNGLVQVSTTSSGSSNTSGQAVLNVTSATNVTAGMFVSDTTNPTYIPIGTYVLSIASNAVTLSANIGTTISAGDTIKFANPFIDCTNFVAGTAAGQGNGSLLIEDVVQTNYPVPTYLAPILIGPKSTHVGSFSTIIRQCRGFLPAMVMFAPGCTMWAAGGSRSRGVLEFSSYDAPFGSTYIYNQFRNELANQSSSPPFGTRATINTAVWDPPPTIDIPSTSGVFNVKAYGAIGDGVTDDTTAVEAAIAAAKAVGGTVLFPPPGTYLISATLYINNSNKPLVFDGGSWNSTVLLANAANVPLFDTNGFTSTGIVFKNIHLNGNGANQSSGAPHIIDGYGMSNCRFSNVWFDNPYTAASLTTGSIGSVRLFQNGSAGNGSGNIIENCLFYNSNATAYQNQVGVLMSQSVQNIVRNCIFNNIGTSGNTHPSAILDNGGSNIIQGNIFLSGTGVYCDSNTASLICDNVFSGTSPTIGQSGTGNIVRNNPGYNPFTVTAPAFPATTVTYTNNTGVDVYAYVTNGTASMTTTVNGNTGPAIAASAVQIVFIPAGGTFVPTYASGSPSWIFQGN